MTETADVRRARLSLEASLDEEYPGESLDPDALRLVLDELVRLQAMEGRARDVAKDGLSLEESEAEAYAARYIIEPW